jgi:hypothetical protein
MNSYDAAPSKNGQGPPAVTVRRMNSSYGPNLALASSSRNLLVRREAVEAGELCLARLAP